MKNKRIRIILLIELLLIVCVIIAALMILSKPGWHGIGDAVRIYTGEDGRLASGYQLIDDAPYYFSKFGTPCNKGWIKDGERSFYCTGSGRLATGWQYMDGKAYYFFEEVSVSADAYAGEQAINYTTSGGIPISDKGYLEGDEALAVAYALDVLERYGWTLESAFKYSSALRFVRNSEEVYGFRIHNCAIQGFKYGEGNCLAWVGTFCAMAKVMGYDCRLVWGTLPYRGEQVPHGWAEIWEKDGIHVYDPRKHEGQDMSGFDERYGEKGSRKYNEDSKQYMEW